MKKHSIKKNRVIYLIVIICLILFSDVFGLKIGSNIIAVFKNGFITVSNHPEQAAVADNVGVLQGPYPVVRVVDGDTIIINTGGIDERIRLIGIDTPESVHPDQEKNVPYGKIASEYTQSLLDGQSVRIELDVQERDKYGRLLAYVYLDGEMLNKRLLAEGHATVDTYPPNVKYVDEFIALQEQARNTGKGMWGDKGT